MLAFKIKNRFVLIALSIITATSVSAQKKTIGSETYDEWNKIEKVQQSPSGDWITYEIKPLEGDGNLIIESTVSSKQNKYPRGTVAKLHYQDKFAAFLIKPQHDTVHKLKLDKVKKIKFPKDTLAIYWADKDSLATFPNITSFKIAQEGDWIAYLSSKDLRPKPKKKKKKKKKKGTPEIKTSGKTLFLYNPINGKKKKLHRIKQYELNKTGSLLAYVTSTKGKKDSMSVHVINLSDFSRTTLLENQLSVQKMTFDHAGIQLLFLSSSDTGKVKNYSLSTWKMGMHNSTVAVDSMTKGMPKGWVVSNNYSPNYSRNGELIFMGTNEIKREPAKDTLLASEKAKVDVWSGQDLRIQPEQLKGLKRDQMKTYKAVLHIADKKFVQLANEEMSSVRTYNHGNASFGLGVDSRNHRRERNWAFPWKSDYYRVNIKSGKKELIKESVFFGRSISPSGKYFIWYNAKDSSWMSTDLISKKDLNLSEGAGVNFASDNNGQPSDAYPQGSSGWTKIGDDEYYVVNDYFDIWYLHPLTKEKSFCLTDKKGRENNIKYSLWRTEYDSSYLSLDRAFIKGVDDLTKNESIYEVQAAGDKYTLVKLLDSPHKITQLSKAKKGDKIIFRRMNFNTYPDLETTNIKFENITKVTDANPQQDEYNWGTVEFVDWKAYDSTELRGLLYKPEDFDPNKSYPMIVYFYETYQNNFHYYYSPKPTASIIYPTEYISNGYIVFIPDVRYEPGHPAKSAYNCIVSGTDYLTDKYNWIDTARLALQGQSWGGYQTAQLVTMTGKYRAAMAGAPVSNMFSAYGGIRWGSGMSRMFQYERTQSRIGYTIWDRPDLYIENSPVFHLPNVTTPLLIMHNDNDGAVPWYQGIELYMGLRRLDKTVWLLNYNGDQHNLTKLPNKRDLSIRMRQFFDYYLLGAEQPLWMKNGLPAIDKGLETGYELEK